MVEKRKRKQKKVAEEANWASYFARIKGVCPWSYRAYMADTILFVEYAESDFNTWRLFLKHTKFEATVFKCPEKSSDWLNNKCDQLNASQTDYEWLWSHPEHGGDSTHIPVLIQQNREQLEVLRDKMGYEDETEIG